MQVKKDGRQCQANKSHLPSPLLCNSSAPTELWLPPFSPGLHLVEAQRAEIGTSLLDASNLLSQIPAPEQDAHDVIFLVTELPVHGELWVADRPLERSQPFFLQSDLAAGRLVYAHHENGGTEDRFQFKAWLQPRAQRSIRPPQEGVLISEAFNVTVSSSSSQKPPQVVKQKGALRVLPNSTITLSRQHLDVAEPQGSPEELVYSLLSSPQAGHLANVRNPQVPIKRFTQADINAGHVLLVTAARGAQESLALSLSDGRHPPARISLEVVVLPTGSAELLEVPQELKRATLTPRHVAPQLGEGDALYTITTEPRFGQVQVNRKPAQGFSQAQLERGEVTFTFTKLTSSEDSFQFLSRSQTMNSTGVVNVTVRALVTARPGSVWPRGTTALLDTSTLDASELANRTHSIPVFRLRQPPHSSRLIRRPRAPGQPAIPIESFSQRELEQGLVGLEVLDDGDTNQQHPHSDSFTFELVAAGVPPALVSLGYITEPYNASKSYGVTLLLAPPAPSSLVPQPQGTARSSPNASEPGSVPPPTSPSPGEGGTFLGFIEANMFSIIIPICLIILLLALILPLLFYLHKRNKTGKHHVQGSPASKAKNGAVPEQETFRKTDPNQGIPLTTVNALDGKGTAPSPQGPGVPADPELLQYCRTSNPALKNNQYWV